MREVAHAALITSLVFVMMAVVEMLAIGSQGRLTAFMGTALLRHQGLATLRKVQEGLNAGRPPVAVNISPDHFDELVQLGPGKTRNALRAPLISNSLRTKSVVS